MADRPMRVAWIVAICLVPILSISLSIWYWDANSRPLADPENTQQVALGQSVYAERCASCHGVNLEGQPDWQVRGANGRLPAPPHDETGHTWHHPDSVLFGITKFGMSDYAPEGYESDMPAFADEISDAQIWATLAYIKSRWSERIAARRSAMTNGDN